MTQPTHLIYQRDGETLLHTSKILSILPISDLADADQAMLKDAAGAEHALITDSTIFHAQGGGQPSDVGRMESESAAEPTSAEPASANPTSANPASSNLASSKPASAFQVKSSRHSNVNTGQVLHLGQFVPDQSGMFSVGEQVQQYVDGEVRTFHSRFHTAGHVMSLAILALSREGVLPVLKEIKASHYPDSAAVVFEGAIDGKHKEAIQAKTDEFVKSARPVKIHWWSMEEVKEKCSGDTANFKLPEGESMARVVEMEGFGSYPCGGTHVADCSKVGKIEVKKISRSKGTTRVSYTVV